LPTSIISNTVTAKPSINDRQKQVASTFVNLGVRLCQENKHR
jgi:hypothetical protein